MQSLGNVFASILYHVSITISQRCPFIFLFHLFIFFLEQRTYVNDLETLLYGILTFLDFNVAYNVFTIFRRQP